MAEDREPLARIVVVDDEQEMRSLLDDYLASHGYHVRTFGLAQDALKALSPSGELAADRTEGDLDAIVTDIRMPGMDGLELTAELQKLRPEIPIIVMTA